MLDGVESVTHGVEQRRIGLAMRETQRQLGECRSTCEAGKIRGQRGTRLDDIEARERIEIAPWFGLYLRDAFGEEIERGAEALARASRAARQHRPYAPLARRQPEDA
jgi:hypothetical protein